LTNITTLPVLSIPIEHAIPISLVTPADTELATKALQSYLDINPQLSINTAYYTNLLSKTFAIYRLFTAKALPNPISWQKSHHGYFSSICDLISILKKHLYTKLAIFTQSRAILATPTIEDLSTSIITGLTKGAADSWLPRLVQWSPPIQPKSTTHGSYVDTNSIFDLSYSAKKTLLHNDPKLPLLPQIPIVNSFSDANTKAIYIHHYFASKCANLTTNTVSPQLFWFPSEYHLNSTTLTSSTKNADRVSAGFVRLLSSMNDSSASNIIKTTDKLIPHHTLQALHVKYTTSKPDQLKSFNQLLAKRAPNKPISTKDRTTPPENVAQFFIPDDEPDQTQEQQQKTDKTSQEKQEEAPQLTKPKVKGPKPNKAGSQSQQQSQQPQQRPAAPILHYNNSSDGWYGERCCFCGSIAPDTKDVPQPPIRCQNGQTQHLQNHPGFCAPCTLIIQDCDPDFTWIKAFVE